MAGKKKKPEDSKRPAPEEEAKMESDKIQQLID
jgi:hypothetical protein